MSGLVYMNARLTAISSAGYTDDYTGRVTPGSDRWTGDVGVTLRERHVEQIAGGNIDQVDQTHLVMPYSIGLIVVRGDVLTYTQNGDTHRRVAGTIVLSRETDRVRVDLENA